MTSTPAPGRLRVLFVDQGRALADSAMGHVRVKHALATGLDQKTVDPLRLDIRPFTRTERRFLKSVPRLRGLNFWTVRFLLLRNWVSRRAIRAAVTGQQPDVVHITTHQVALTLRRLQRRVPCVLSVDTPLIDWSRMTHGVPAGARTPAHLRPIVVLERRALRRAPLVIAWTQTVGRRLTELAPDANVQTVHPGLDTAAFSLGERSADDRPARILFVGANWERKGGPALLDAVGSELGRTLTLDVVTSVELPATPGLTQHRGKPGSSEIAALFQRADIFCLPTSVDAVPWVVLEAMACGAAVVATRVGSIPEMVGDGGVLVDPGDTEQLGQALRELSHDLRRCHALGSAGRRRVEEHYDAAKNTRVLSDLVQHVARAGRTGADDTTG
ncbi:glycosyltransferase family 4 protein [uncultured Jatrophihabitans sp.]|uniref:glycosyltransferase family 4 protein n=1 Tax=uncultured Jatrophihabitans sp. TaxID=1610747 RepID=UPI0035C98067